ncbi:MAG: carotenoid 1,2-hydratase [Chloroflexota bacterium]|nr:MAG: carotenoid 1,2-hydratase [Chloroflexota bacterium]
MSRRLLIAAIGLIVLSLVGVLALGPWRTEEAKPRARLVAPTVAATGFARVEGPRELSFPADDGPHPDYQTEWWYYTGNLQDADGQHFGYQLTIFRRALVAAPRREQRPSTWSTDQIYMAHFAVTDVAGRRHRAFERFSRGAAALAGAQAAPHRVWLEDWSVEEIQPHVYRLRAAQDELSVDLLLTDRKGPVLQGDRGYSRKGPDPGNASLYYSRTRLETSGTLHVGGKDYQANGLSWMDHEFSTSSLSQGQVGWNWMALQLDDGSELMLYQMRREDGGVDPYSSGTVIAPDGSTRRLTVADFQIASGATWRSPHSGATYPARWTVKIPGLNLTLEIEPYLSDQELNVSYAYWEGAVRITGARAGQPVGGDGYIEMTGYAGSMQGEL